MCPHFRISSVNDWDMLQIIWSWDKSSRVQLKLASDQELYEICPRLPKYCPSTKTQIFHQVSADFQPVRPISRNTSCMPWSKAGKWAGNPLLYQKKRINRWVNRQKRLWVVNRWNGLNHPCATMENLVSDRWCSGEITHLGGQGLTRATLFCL